jgi:LppP/LprE lipoprotein
VANTMHAMRVSLLRGFALLLGVSAAALLGACGSGTKTVSVAGAPPVSQSTGATARTTSVTSATTPSSSTPAQTTTNGGTPAQTSTHAAPEPAFTQQEAAAEGLSGAAAVVRARGFTPNDTSQYHSNQALRVLIGTRTGSGDGYGQQAFFFVNGRYIGTDSSQPSATVRVAAQGDTEVTLAYPLYRKNDALCCPGGGQAAVHFQLNNGKLVALNPIPPVSRANGAGRY